MRYTKRKVRGRSTVAGACPTGERWMLRMISTTMAAATIQSTMRQNGGHHRVLAT
jgi:hypothetical protein